MEETAGGIKLQVYPAAARKRTEKEGRESLRGAGAKSYIACMQIAGVTIEDTFAEAFPMTAARLIVTAETRRWVDTTAQVTTGYATSVIGCDVEAGVEKVLEPGETPDGRPGVSLLFFAFSRDALQKAAVNRVGQCI